MAGVHIVDAAATVMRVDAGVMAAAELVALVHANERTSSPILQWPGFEVYGQQRVVALEL